MRSQMMITGGAGFIGSHLAESLHKDYDIVIFDNYRRNSIKHSSLTASNIRLVEGDVLDVDALAKAMDGAEVVLHLAAIAGVSSYYKDPVATLRINILGTINVLEAMRCAKVKRIIDFSTSEVYGTQADHVDEESPHGIGPVSQRRWVYAVSKLASEHFTLRYGEEYQMDSTCIRPFNIYGPRQTGEGCISNFCDSVVSGKPLLIHGDGQDVRAWCHVSDMVAAIRLILEKPASVGLTFNIGNPSQAATTEEIAKKVMEISGHKLMERVPAPHSGIRLRIPNIDRARTILGFEPKVTLKEGLADTLRWYREVACVS